MRGKSVARYVIILIAAFAAGSVYAQQQERPNARKSFRLRFLKPTATALNNQKTFRPPSLKLRKHARRCGLIMRSIHCATNFRGKVKTQLSRCSRDKTRLLPKDKPLADLFVKTIDKCKALQRNAIALL